MKKKKIQKKLRKLQQEVAQLKRPPSINPIGFMYSLRNDHVENDYEEIGY